MTIDAARSISRAADRMSLLAAARRARWGDSIPGFGRVQCAIRDRTAARPHTNLLGHHGRSVMAKHAATSATAGAHRHLRSRTEVAARAGTTTAPVVTMETSTAKMKNASETAVRRSRLMWSLFCATTGESCRVNCFHVHIAQCIPQCPFAPRGDPGSVVGRGSATVAWLVRAPGLSSRQILQRSHPRAAETTSTQIPTPREVNCRRHAAESRIGTRTVARSRNSQPGTQSASALGSPLVAQRRCEHSEGTHAQRYKRGRADGPR